MSMAIPGWGAAEMIVRTKRQLFKQGWRQMKNGRMDCIEKDFGDVTVGTIWAGNDLLLIPRVKGSDEVHGEWVTPSEKRMQAIRLAAEELKPVFDKFVAQHRAKWEKEIKEYEASPAGHKISRSEVYGI